jgi:saccharopine dehydrogenase-like NADP-dependent oxidoreductase
LRTTLWEFHPDEPMRVYYRDGEFHWVGPFEGLKRVEFPGPIGEQETCYIPHPDTRTLPHSLGARSVSVRGCFAPRVMGLMKAMLENGLYSEGKIRINGNETTPLEIMENLLLRLPESKQADLWGYGLVVEVSGTRAGRQVRLRLWNRHPPQEEWGGPAAYFKNIALPLSIGAQLLASGAVKRTGVIPPEVAFEPEDFFAELGRRGIQIHEQVVIE